MWKRRRIANPSPPATGIAAAPPFRSSPGYGLLNDLVRKKVRPCARTDRGPFCRLVLREELPVIQAELAVEGAIGWWVTECPDNAL